MKLTLSVIKADIGSIGGHIQPSRKVLETERSQGASTDALRGRHRGRS